MKKLNRKGFTLIELLAVIVIMAIILVVTLPYILDSVGNAKVSSIHNLSVSAAKTYTDMAAADMIAPAAERKLTYDKIGMTVTSNWQCISAKLAETLGISTVDVVTKDPTDGATGVPVDSTLFVTDSELVEGKLDSTTCSAIKFDGSSTRILLVAKDNGKFAESGFVVYALSAASNGKKK